MCRFPFPLFHSNNGYIEYNFESIKFQKLNFLHLIKRKLSPHKRRQFLLRAITLNHSEKLIGPENLMTFAEMKILLKPVQK